jgi:hypothetical protein
MNTQPIHSESLRFLISSAALALWVGLVGFGMNTLWRYSNTPGQRATPPSGWPAEAPVQPGKGRATLVMFAHPNCPCSRASIGELAIILAHADGMVDAHVFFYKPVNEASTWVRTDLWHSAGAIPGVHLHEDPEGALARRFGASTSGQTLLYNAGGRVVFNGGITAARGHSGDNNGRHAIVALLHGATPDQNLTPVFGCSLRGE